MRKKVGKMRSFFGALLVVLTGSIQVAIAQSQPPNRGFRLEVTQLIRAHPIGLAWWTNFGWREPLSSSTNRLLKGTHIEGGIKQMTSPASVHPGVYFKALPITPIVLDIEAQQLRFFGLFGTMSEYEGRSPNWHPSTREGSITNGRHETGWRVSARATIQLKLGPFFTQTAFRREWLWMNVERGNTWYDPTTDLLFSHADILHRIDSTVGFFFIGDPNDDVYLLAGAHWQGYWVRDTDADRHIIGGIILTRPGWWRARRMVLGLLMGYNAVDVYRENEIYAGAIMRVSWERIGQKN